MPELASLIPFLLIGAFAGIAAGLLGIGGGLIIVPFLAILFQAQGIDSNVLMHLVIGTSLASIIFTSVSSVSAHHKNRAVLWTVFGQLSLGIMLGASLGSLIADQMPTKALRIFFGIFEIYVATQMILNIKPKPNRTLPQALGMNTAGAGIGLISSIVGIGGGTMTVPFLTWCNVTIKKAIATSAACGLPIAVAGSIGFIITGWNETQHIDSTLGYIHLPSLIGIVIASVVFAPIGAHFAHRLPDKILKQAFAVLLYFLGIKMLLGI